MKVSFSDVLEIRNGRNQKAVENPNGTYPIYGSGGMMGRADDYICPANTVVIGRKGSINNPIFVEEPFWNVDTAFGLVADETRLLPRYLYYFCVHFDFEKLNTTVTIPSLTKANLLKLAFDLPEISTQKQVVSILDRIEGIMKKSQQELNALDDLIKARFVEMFGDPVHNDRKWPIRPLDDVCRTIVDCPHSTPSYTSEDTGYMCIRTSIVKKNRILWDNIEYISKEEFEQRIKRKKPETGDVIYTREGAILGIAAVIDKDCNVALGQRSMLLSPDKKYITPEFLSIAMNFDSFLDSALRGMIGSASPHINVSDIKKSMIVLPPIERQKVFSEFVTQIKKTRISVQNALDDLQQLFNSLMQKHFG